MKTSMYIFFIVAGLMWPCFAQSQTLSTFEDLSLPQDTFWDGSDFSGGFANGNAFFSNLYLYDSVYGGYWAAGFAYSSMRDSITGNYNNIFSARPAGGAESSSTYAVGQQGAILSLTGAAIGKVVNGCYLTNTTYAAISMRDGDAFAKKFGGPTGNDPDWFRLTVFAWYNGSLKSDSVNVYLADYRFSDNQQDYILEDWNWLDLSSLGNCDSLLFVLNSSDTGMFGMNTPPFFCIDNFTTADSPQSLKEITQSHWSCHPNPVSDFLNISYEGTPGPLRMRVCDAAGRLILTQESKDAHEFILDCRDFNRGCYILHLLREGENPQRVQFIKL